MTQYAIQNRFALGSTNDLTTPTSTRKYPLGAVVQTFDEENDQNVKEYIYVKSHGALTQYQPYAVVNLGTSASEWVTAAPATLASAQVLIGVPQVAFTSGYYGFVQIKGGCTAKITASTGYVASNSMEVLNAGTTMIAASTGVVQTVTTVGFLVTATTGTTGTVQLNGFRTETAAA